MKLDLENKIRKNALSLKHYNLDDLCWNKEDAINLILAIMEDEIGILGGDVYRLSHYLEPLYDNWHCEIHTSESMISFYKRSKIESLRYIESYPAEPRDVFSITFTKKITI